MIAVDGPWAAVWLLEGAAMVLWFMYLAIRDGDRNSPG